MAVVERAVAAMDAHRGEVDVVKSGLGFLRSMSRVDDKVWGACGSREMFWCNVGKWGSHEST
jgi:hypothetical protein